MTPRIDAVAAELQALLGERLTASASERAVHGADESYRTPAPPDLVAYPESTDEVAAIVRACARERVPLIPYGAGTSLEGHVAAVAGGVCIDTSRMNSILAVRPEDLDATVQAGVTRRRLSDVLARQGYFFPVDPGADATLGGMAATRASGTTTVRYGSMRDNVLSLTVVLADGRVIRTGSRARKSAAGYDLTRLFVGSEGTLGVITELTLRIYGTPEAMSVAVCAFPTVDAAVACVIQVVQLGIPVARAELLDEVYVDAVNRRTGLEYPAVPTVLFEFHGGEASVAEDATAVAQIARELGAADVTSATRQEDRTRLWRARHEAYYAGLALRPGSKGFVTDVCVPLSRLADCIAATKADIAETSLLAPILGHVGDGNFHVTFFLDPDSAEELETARRINRRMVTRAIEMGGTCSGEHGVGYGKAEFLAMEHGDGVAVMAALKRALDPLGILNPGKMTDAAVPASATGAAAPHTDPEAAQRSTVPR
ncbi:MAG TPA: FAD-linked oxidase C-terminal domain-containing protein [Candidatus Dormibacteraeota bacterium]|nr:FAD-linked oxidase C-terminal domain-containing protein [Candidatus Dormibacteraeota bacterium]